MLVDKNCTLFLSACLSLAAYSGVDRDRSEGQKRVPCRHDGDGNKMMMLVIVLPDAPDWDDLMWSLGV
jgi:hypothetical protein